MVRFRIHDMVFELVMVSETSKKKENEIYIKKKRKSPTNINVQNHKYLYYVLCR